MMYTHVAVAAADSRRNRVELSAYDLAGESPPPGYEPAPRAKGKFRKRLPSGRYDYWEPGSSQSQSGEDSSSQPVQREPNAPEWSESDSEYRAAGFNIDGQEFAFECRKDHEGVWEILFAKGDVRQVWRDVGISPMQERTSGFKVFKMVFRLTRKFIAEVGPAQVQFSASSDEKSRVRLYDTMAQRLAKVHGYRVDRQVKRDELGRSHVVYKLTRTWLNWAGRMIGRKG